MNQVGDLKKFVVQGTPPAGSLAYVYRWWDDSVAVTSNGTGIKQINMGGNPSDAGLLRFKVVIVDDLGNSQVLNNSIQVNNPPTIIPSPTLSLNDGAFPFQTTITTRAYDMEGDAFSFLWYDGTIAIPSGSTVSDGVVTGTYAGTLVGSKSSFKNIFSYAVTQNKVLTLKLVDAQSGTSSLNFELRGISPQAPSFSLAFTPPTVAADASTLPTQVIAPGQFAQFTAYASDSVAGSISFYWAFYGSNGWSSTIFSTGSSVPAQNGLRNNVFHALSTETAGLKTAYVTVTNTVTGKSDTANVEVTLVENAAPVISYIQAFDPGLNGTITTISHLASPAAIRFSGTATDANNDVVTFKWSFIQPSGVLPTNLVLWGREVTVDVSGYAGQFTQGSVVAVDRFGVSSVPFNIPQIPIT
jgi:hypothetical protein